MRMQSVCVSWRLRKRTPPADREFNRRGMEFNQSTARETFPAPAVPVAETVGTEAERWGARTWYPPVLAIGVVLTKIQLNGEGMCWFPKTANLRDPNNHFAELLKASFIEHAWKYDDIWHHSLSHDPSKDVRGHWTWLTPYLFVVTALTLLGLLEVLRPSM